MKNINEVIQDAVKEINFEEIVKEAASSKIKEAVKKSIDDQFSRYGNSFGKQLDEHLTKELGVDLSSVKLPEYRAFLMKSVTNALASFTNEEHAKEITTFINSKVVGESRDEIEFSAFWDELCQMIEDACEDEDNCKYKVEISLDEKSWSSRDYYSINIMADEESYSSYKKEKKSVFKAHISGQEIYHVSDYDDHELSSVYTWLKALKFRKTKILEIKSEEANIPQRDW